MVVYTVYSRGCLCKYMYTVLQYTLSKSAVYTCMYAMYSVHVLHMYVLEC